MCDNEIYYKLYLTRDQKVTVVCMQWFDEAGYNPVKFVIGEDGDPVMFETENKAVAYLNECFVPEVIDPEYVSPNNPDFLKHV